MRDFNDLQFFAAVVRHNGFTAAARVLAVPKSRVSRRVSLLEEQLGVRLLDRTTRGLSLTEVGQQVFAHAQAAVIEAEAAEEAALRMQTEPRGQPPHRSGQSAPHITAAEHALKIMPYGV